MVPPLFYVAVYSNLAEVEVYRIAPLGDVVTRIGEFRIPEDGMGIILGDRHHSDSLDFWEIPGLTDMIRAQALKMDQDFEGRRVIESIDKVRAAWEAVKNR